MALDASDSPAIFERVPAGNTVALSSHTLVSDPPANPSAARPLRFILVGGLATLTQLALLALLLRLGWSASLANAAALFASTQVNFALNACCTWRDRWDATDRASARGERTRLVASRWLRFMGAAAGTVSLRLPRCILTEPIAVSRSFQAPKDRRVIRTTVLSLVLVSHNAPAPHAMLSPPGTSTRAPTRLVCAYTR